MASLQPAAQLAMDFLAELAPSSSLDLDARKQAGRVFTPEPVARALAEWAIRSPDDLVLDLGVGEGVFVVAAARRLMALGAAPDQAAGQIVGAELDPHVYAQARRSLERALGSMPPQVTNQDFYALSIPPVDAVVGNPPYIRRHYLADPDRVRQAAGASDSGRLADAYLYFLLRACRALKPGGRLAVIVSASWLDMNYGRALKQSLSQAFKIHLLLGFDGRVFSDALIKPVVVLAEKGGTPHLTVFARWRHSSPLEPLASALPAITSGGSSSLAVATPVPQGSLSPAAPWSTFLKDPGLSQVLRQNDKLTTLHSVARSRIGLQTFAKGFYIMRRERAQELGIEERFLLPLAFSPREIREPVIRHSLDMRYVVFACDSPPSHLQGTGAGRYIQRAEETPVAVRGKGYVVAGYHLAPRLLRAGRIPWYNIKSEIERRATFPILLPRRSFASYLVVHNLARVVPNEDFIEVEPFDQRDTLPLLAFLNSSIGEFFVRLHSFQYGGGVYNLNPGQVRDLPVLDCRTLTADGRSLLESAWDDFVRSGGYQVRAGLDRAVAHSLALNGDDLDRTRAALATLTSWATNAGRPHRQAARG